MPRPAALRPTLPVHCAAWRNASSALGRALLLAPLLALGVGLGPGLSAQVPVRDAAELEKQLDRLQTMGSVLYLAAHPDDENTAVLATLSKGRNLRTAYLAITRGGGGQNLIGPELGDGLAAIRTQELLAARRVDGAEQYFTSSVDFGFSKTAEESLRMWGHDRILAEVVRTIRTFRPDVILTRFPPDARAGHGHHAASALLAIEAFKAAADPHRFPEQIAAGLRPWQATRLLWNHYLFTDEAPAPPTGSLALESRREGAVLPDNEPRKVAFSFAVPADTPLSQPHWLGGPGAEAWAGLPESPAPFRLRARLKTSDGSFEVTVPVQYRFRDPVLGERYQPLAVVPAALVTFADPVLAFETQAAKELRLQVLAGGAAATGRVRLRVPEGWAVDPSEQTFALAHAGEKKELTFHVTPPVAAASGALHAEVDLGAGFSGARSLVVVDHPHIPLQTLLPEAKVRLERFDLKHDGRRIGYVMGAGDDIPQALRRIGYEVELLTDEALAREDLARFDAIVLGIRAFNTRPALQTLKERLHAYVAAGGTELVLYTVNTGFPGINAAMVTEAIGPYPFKVGRKRVTVETVPVRLLKPDHPVFHWPNELRAADFDGWVQERSLYHAEGWDARYTPLLGMADPGEAEDAGALIVARHGKGHYVYTGLSFFRQLPDGVPGATRLFANLLALGHAHD
ncbi:PIG-L family deacetylase [Geothrix alkalitolerans]|uniref:PIG-L family deacetylase n=1 Tax=Geothrix alkalitolerans TaxID=2922724 RepID=UPI001FAF61F0|nr:PIG-L family deacetylase [Geothrix alkalitolerans]